MNPLEVRKVVAQAAADISKAAFNAVESLYILNVALAKENADLHKDVCAAQAENARAQLEILNLRIEADRDTETIIALITPKKVL